MPRTSHHAPHSLLLTDLFDALASPRKAEAALDGSVVVEDPEVREIIAQPTLRRRISSIRFAGDRRTYEFLMMHPPLATQLAKRVHPPLERYTVTQVREGVYTVEDRGALRGDARLIAATGDQRIYRFQGEFRTLAHLIRFNGRMVLILRYREIREGSQIFMDSDPDFYLRIDNPLFHVMTKFLSPLLASIIDRRVNMIIEATSKLFDQVQTNPEVLYQQMRTWAEVQPADLEAFREAFLGKEAVTR
jgi:hypothetical protein